MGSAEEVRIELKPVKLWSAWGRRISYTGQFIVDNVSEDFVEEYNHLF